MIGRFPGADKIEREKKIESVLRIETRPISYVMIILISWFIRFHLYA